MRQKLSEFIHDGDALFEWMNEPFTTVSVLDLSCRSGLFRRILDAPSTIGELATLTQVPAEKLARIVDVLRAHDLVDLTAAGEVTASCHTRRAEELDGAWLTFLQSCAMGLVFLEAVREGKTPFEKRFGQPVFDYFAGHPMLGEQFRRYMDFMNERAIRFIRQEHAFRPFRTAVDIGGSNGGLLMSVLDSHPGTRGILFDLPGVADQTRQAVADSSLADRVTVVGGSFFEEVPTADLYLLKQIVHDWSDEECVLILRTIRRAIEPDGRLAVIDHVLADPPQPNEGQMTDIIMMLWVTGRERKLAEFETLFDASGFRLDQVSQNPNGQSVIEAVPV